MKIPWHHTSRYVINLEVKADSIYSLVYNTVSLYYICTLVLVLKDGSILGAKSFSAQGKNRCNNMLKKRNQRNITVSHLSISMQSLVLCNNCHLIVLNIKPNHIVLHAVVSHI